MAQTTSQLPEYMRLLPASALSQLGKLGLTSRGPVQGFVTGRHTSPYKGFSAEFAEHRPYVVGDDPRNLDWRVFGKSDRYYVKQYIEETNLRATLLVDASGSMQFAGQQAALLDGMPASKFGYAQRVAAALTYVMVQQQDAVGLVTFDTAIRKYIPASSRPSQIRLILEELNGTEAKRETDPATIFHDIAERIPRGGLVIIVSDLFGDVEAIGEALFHFRYRKHEVIVLHVMADEELTFPFDQWASFRNLEDLSMQAQLDPQSIRAAYLNRVQQFVKTVERQCGRLHIDYVPMNTKVPYETALTSFLAGRK